MKKIKNVAILGSTGSIGVNALKVLEPLKDRFRVVGLSSFSNIELLAKQIERFKPSLATVVEPNSAKKLKQKISAKSVKFFSTIDGLNAIVESEDVDIVIIAISGSAAIYPLLAAIKAGKHICLANKESIVMAGNIVMEEAKRYGAKVIPVDSEHSAIFQCINSQGPAAVNRIYLTGSGGPLHKVPKEKFSQLLASQVLRHPKWKMGKKITVDSATLMNKGLEIIEAGHLFNIPIDRIEVLIHPEAIIHSMVEFIDGTVIAQLGITDMRLPIQYALTYPERVDTGLPKLDFSKVSHLTFSKPNMSKYPCLGLAIKAARMDGPYPAVLSAADEIAVKAFLEGRINFVEIADIIRKVLRKYRPTKKTTLDDIFSADRWAREGASSLC